MSKIKRMLAVMIIVALCVSGTALAEENAAAYEGVWQCGRATIALYWEEEGFKVQIRWGSSAWEHTEWEYSCHYREEDNTLLSTPFGVRTEYVYGDDGQLVSATEVYDDGEAAFSLDAEGFLLWQDMKENAGDGMRFEKMPQEESLLPFATIGDAMAAECYTGVSGGDEDHVVVGVEMNGEYLRLVANLDEKAKELNEATLNFIDFDKLEAAFEAYNTYIETLPIAYAETITAVPKDQAELDALAGKTLRELEEAGYEFSWSETGENDVFTYCVSNGLFDYALTLNETFEEYTAHEDNGTEGELTVKSARLFGLSRNVVDLRYHADGTVEEEENDPWAALTTLVEKFTDALNSDKDLPTIVQELAEEIPEEEAIQLFSDIFSVLSEPSGENEN